VVVYTTSVVFVEMTAASLFAPFRTSVLPVEMPMIRFVAFAGERPWRTSCSGPQSPRRPAPCESLRRHPSLWTSNMPGLGLRQQDASTKAASTPRVRDRRAHLPAISVCQLGFAWPARWCCRSISVPAVNGAVFGIAV